LAKQRQFVVRPVKKTRLMRLQRVAHQSWNDNCVCRFPARLLAPADYRANAGKSFAMINEEVGG
jgi:hypothetical protein